MLVRLVLVITVLSATWTFAPAARADEPTEAEIDSNPNVYPPMGTRGSLALTGAALTVGWYGVGVGNSYLWSDAPGARDLRLPVVGPFMALSKTGCGDHESGCGTFTLIARTLLTTLSAAGQVGGVAALVESLFLPVAASESASLPPRPEPEFAAVPLVSEHSLGLGVTGCF